jgi:hypothetical protein
MPTRPIFKLLQVSLFLFAQFAFLTLARAQAPIPINFQGRVMYSSGDPAVGATVTMSVTVSGATSTQTTSSGSGGNYIFQTQRNPGQGISCEFSAASSEIVDGELLPPSPTNSTSGGLSGNITIADLVIPKPHLITLGGIVRDQTNTPSRA